MRGPRDAPESNARLRLVCSVIQPVQYTLWKNQFMTTRSTPIARRPVTAWTCSAEKLSERSSITRIALSHVASDAPNATAAPIATGRR